MFAKINQAPLLNINVEVLPSPDNTTLVWPLKFEGVIVAANEPDDDVFKNIFTWPSAPFANVIVPAADVAFISVIAEVKSATDCVEPSVVIDCEDCFNPNQVGILLKIETISN